MWGEVPLVVLVAPGAAGGCFSPPQATLIANANTAAVSLTPPGRMIERMV